MNKNSRELFSIITTMLFAGLILPAAVCLAQTKVTNFIHNQSSVNEQNSNSPKGFTEDFNYGKRSPREK